MNMFTILIIEDNLDKLRDIYQTLESTARFKGMEIEEYVDHELDAFGAKKRLKEKNYDLLILDIAIPLRKAEQIDLEGGLKLLDEILKRENYKIPIHIIGLTAHHDIFDKASSKFGSQGLHVIKYSNTDIEWQSQLKNGVQQRVMAKSAALTADLSYDYDIAIINAIEVEYQAVKALSTNWKKVSIPSDATAYYETVFENHEKKFRVIHACAFHMGMNATSVLSMKMIYNFRPKYLFMTGIMASVKNIKLHGFGDVVLIDEVWDGGAGKITEENGSNVFFPTASHLRLNPDISQKMRSLKDNSKVLREIKDCWKPSPVPNTELSIHIGSVTSVAGVIENKAVIEELKRKDRKLLGLEMEAYGMYYSSYNCNNPKPIASIALKGISDFASTEKSDEYQNYASFTSAKIMYEFILSEL